MRLAAIDRALEQELGDQQPVLGRRRAADAAVAQCLQRRWLGLGVALCVDEQPAVLAVRVGLEDSAGGDGALAAVGRDIALVVQADQFQLVTEVERVRRTNLFEQCLEFLAGEGQRLICGAQVSAGG